MRMKPEERRQEIIKVAIDHAIEYGYLTINRNTIAHRAGISRSLISHYFGNADGLVDIVMRYAVEQHIHIIIAQGWTCGHPAVMNAPLDLITKSLSEVGP